MSLQYYFCILEACILNYQMNCCDTVQYTRTLVGLLATVAQKGQTKISLPKHKTVSQNTNQFPKTQINFPKHKSVYQNTKFFKTQTNFQNTNQFTKTQINFTKHKPISRNTNQKTGHLFCHYQRTWKGLIPRIFHVQHGDLSYAVRTFENVLPQPWV